MKELSNEIYGYADKIFNINSPKQLASVLYDDLGLKGGGRKRSTSAEVLEKLRGVHPIIEVCWTIGSFPRSCPPTLRVEETHPTGSKDPHDI